MNRLPRWAILFLEDSSFGLLSAFGRDSNEIYRMLRKQISSNKSASKIIFHEKNVLIKDNINYE